jgi:hypothetical protein
MIGIGLVLASSRACMEIEMVVFDGRHLDVGVLINHSSANIMTEEHLGYWYGAPSIGYPDLGTDGALLHGGFGQFFSPGRAIDVDWLRLLAIPRHGHECTKARGVVVMIVRKKNRADLSEVNTSLCKTPCDTVASINDIMRPVDGEEVGGLRIALLLLRRFSQYRHAFSATRRTSSRALLPPPAFSIQTRSTGAA